MAAEHRDRSNSLFERGNFPVGLSGLATIQGERTAAQVPVIKPLFVSCVGVTSIREGERRKNCKEFLRMLDPKLGRLLFF